MTISSSLNAGVAGLAANANRLAAISDNIANSSTFGYKRVETDFHAMVISSGASKYSAGGVRSTTQRMIDQSGALIGTSNATDIAVRGRGFFPVTDLGSIGLDGTGTPLRLATTGSFRLDEDGILRTATGMVLMGVKANPDGSIPPFPRDTQAGLQPIQVPQNQLVGEPTTEVSLGINLPATNTMVGAAATPRDLSVEYFDNLGISRTLNITMTPVAPVAPATASNEWTVEIFDSATGGTLVGEYNVTFNDARTGGGAATLPRRKAITSLTTSSYRARCRIDFGSPRICIRQMPVSR
jgi:flagellar hook protein FlgE